MSFAANFSGPPYSTVPYQISEDPPFTHVGVDFAGPSYVKCGVNTVKSNEQIKSYVCMFTCASTRAIHLES